MNNRLNLKDLDPADQRELEAIASETGKSPGELLRDLVHEALAGRRRNGSSSGDDGEDVVRAQHAEWERLDRELSALPVSEKAVGFSGRDHDEILYGWKKR